MAEVQPDIEYQAHLAEGHFMIQRGIASGVHHFYPRAIEPGTGRALEWVEASGKGKVHSVTVISRKPPLEPYNVVLVDLAEGPRMMSRVDGIDPAAIRIGMAVTARIVEEDERQFVVFVPAEEA
ncbi:Zn-ribbon domain-containing OB-fold protein [Novosphingobium cyanobacteriorum]|uniref:OB-fold domain-containing protein n=1 Tax=Novosphingobium cyanobacteriorum TaxID=3024215 RepID=A0ABT6CL07_9SPHN|nr:OB-fold domain-containing protein [Novosphingobium cyanobacteriorum]MDF8334586.1 OB-fold domain-containing protein [Novosphingobium cyanobacteriorum]